MLPVKYFFKVQLDNLPEIGFRHRKLSEIFQAVQDEDDPVALGDKHLEVGIFFYQCLRALLSLLNLSTIVATG